MTAAAARATTAAVRDEYAALAAAYDARWARYVAATTARTLAHVELEPGETLLDVGCGTGVLLAALRARTPGAQRVGVDLSPPMLAAARGQLGAAGALVAADAMCLPIGARRADVAVSVSSLHYWPEPLAALREIGRVLRPGGRLVLTDWCDDFRTSRLWGRWLRLRGWAPVRIYGAGECSELLAAAGFAVRRVERYKVSWLWGMMTLVASRSADPVAT